LARERFDEAIPYFKEAIEWSEMVLGHEDYGTVKCVQSLVTLLGRQRRIGEAVYYLDRWHKTILNLAEDEDTIETRVHMGIAFHKVGRVEEALRLIEGAVRWTRNVSDREGTPHPKLAGRLVTYANLLDQRGHHPEAEGLIREALDVEQRAYGEQSGPVAIRYAQLADYLCGYNRRDEAAGWYEVSVTTMMDIFGVEHEQTQGVAEKLIDCLLAMCAAEPPGKDRQDRIVSHIGRARHWGTCILGTSHTVMNKVRNFEF
jgi:tetratricopeptide (TPR) repeat protein